MTYLDAISQADALAPNAISQDKKVRWLREAEGLLADTLLGPGEQAQSLTQPLRAPPPWDSLYVHWLTMQIHYVHGDIPRYNQANALYRTLWGGFRDWHHRTCLPPRGEIQYF